MRGPTLIPSQVTALGAWLDALPRERPEPGDAAAIARGKALFTTSCASCHAGAKGTRPESADVGTGGAFQVPWMTGAWTHSPWLHDGCAQRLEDVFSAKCAPSPATITHASVLGTASLPDILAYVRAQ